MKQKVGIVSLYKGQNFGNKLQNYAVETIIKNYGFEPETFKYEIRQDYKPVCKATRDKFKISYIKSFIKIKIEKILLIKNSDRGIVSKILWRLSNKNKIKEAQMKRLEKYTLFDEKYLHFSGRIIKLDEKEKTWTSEYFRFICGSDQVWNPYYLSTSGICFLQFVDKEKRVAFSPSFGVSVLPDDKKNYFRQWINEIPFLSVREKEGQQIIQSLCNRDAEVLVDPTMVLSKDEWKQFYTAPTFDLPKNYLLTYFLGDRTREYAKHIKRIAAKYELVIVDLLDLMKPEYFSCSPDEFVYCIEHADFICTDSFHACVFSIIFNRPFQAFSRKEGVISMESRITTLLKTFNLEENIYNSKIKKIEFEGDFERCNYILSLERRKVENFLDKAFEI